MHVSIKNCDFSYVQWNPSITATIGELNFGLYRGVALTGKVSGVFKSSYGILVLDMHICVQYNCLCSNNKFDL